MSSSPPVRPSMIVGSPSYSPTVAGYEWVRDDLWVGLVGPGQYISPLSSKLACGQKRLSSVERDCPVVRESV